MLLMGLSSSPPMWDYSPCFFSFTFPSAEGLVKKKKELLLAICQKIFKSYKPIVVSLNHQACEQ
jgi:hypothetical protein